MNYVQLTSHRLRWRNVYLLLKLVRTPLNVLLHCHFVPRFRESVETLNLIRPSVCLSVSQSVRPSVRLSVTKTLTFTITFEPLKVGLSYFTCTFLMMRPCHSYQNFDLVTLNVTFDLHILKFNICHNFSTIRGSAFIFYMYSPCDEAFLFIPNRLTLWPWPWPLTFIPENARYAITFEILQVELTYFTCTFLVMRLFRSYQSFWPCDLHHDLWPSYPKILYMP